MPWQSVSLHRLFLEQPGGHGRLKLLSVNLNTTRNPASISNYPNSQSHVSNVGTIVFAMH